MTADPPGESVNVPQVGVSITEGLAFKTELKVGSSQMALGKRELTLKTGNGALMLLLLLKYS